MLEEFWNQCVTIEYEATSLGLKVFISYYFLIFINQLEHETSVFWKNLQNSLLFLQDSQDS